MENQFNEKEIFPHEINGVHTKETEAHESEQKYRRIFEDSIDGLILWDNEHRFVDVNIAAERMIGLPKNKLIGQRVYDLSTPLEGKKQEILKHIDQLLNEGQKASTITFETEDGNKIYFDYTSQLDIVDGVNLTVFKDVTDKVVMQEQLRKSDTLNVIGELAAGIAHEIRNPMTALKGFIQLLESSITKEHSLYYQVITTELQRIDSIINEFLILAKPQAVRFQEKDINKIMKETVDLLSAQAVLYNVQFVTNYDESLPLVFCEPNQLKKVFINLIKNAIEVMPNGGSITITTKKMRNQQIQIIIKDEGCGISKEKIKKLGEPFYTTKDRGTGLGLMVSYRIIDEHKGTIFVKSEEGKGTIFNIKLPIKKLHPIV
ncbi:PAS domain S-box protein [Neobacillus sp. MM2021_6]|uniref:PAS domain-containing sensor histidine kinase n=1 Tax=Bacillaceae TaxID=186817 RepID=UPI001408D04D|nr:MULTISPECIES: ATP-binding protein [Bacillaceae]MBO0960391.1 PAS domain S-box protein [Neobacillus sp. MM2021_6]NHC16752.1 PAS domain S-box protein [Bacillus sp. MM2020_4]